MTAGDVPITSDPAGGTLDLGIRKYVFVGVSVAATVFGGLLLWSLFAPIDGAVIASGVVTVESNKKTVQHLEGGIVDKILVTEGQAVTKGQLLIRLDDTVTKANLAVVRDQLIELSAREGRLRAERDGAAEIDWPHFLHQIWDEPDVRDVTDGQHNLFRVRRETRHEELALLNKRIRQLGDEIDGLNAQVKSKQNQIQIIREELNGLRLLHQKGHVPITRILLLEREAEQLLGDKGAHIAEIARANNRIGEAGIEINRLHSAFQEEVIAELRDIKVQVQERLEEKITAEDTLRRLDVLAPQSGYVLELQIHTQGGVVQAGQPIMYIVPKNDELVVEVNVEPKDIDNVTLHSPARIRFSSFNQRTTPEIEGRVTRVSNDLISDQEQQTSYYRVRIGIEDEEIARLNGLELLPGMPTEAFIRTGERSALSYLLKPLTDAFSRSMKED